MATYNTEIHTGGGGWQEDSPLTLSIGNRGDVVGNGAPEAGTTVTWNSPNAGAGNVTFFDDGNSFRGTAQFPNEGPVEYRGSLAD
ncbi:hypothetical protein [Kitasatospora sp. SUK 42]|uniref:hypothetical protein n=1 Tax=Kitasatospora sp. SUK 42 TaxID=1588882 RepID=UPI0018CA429A|nr:hypothetical protein [Kitasatospora sp. SUK 42]MBV2152500.1 hypothetical protein [Kitasatospora sp. SUK 42]